MHPIYECDCSKEKIERDRKRGILNRPVRAMVVGIPNVGKSTFFNYIVGSRISIVEDTPGVTRDRVYAETNWRGRNFTVVDTAGIEPESDDTIISQMREQAKIAIDIADVILFLTDVKQGVTAADEDIAIMLKKARKPVVLVCNKSDSFGKVEDEIYEFYNLGLGDPYAISATNAKGLGDVLDAVYENFVRQIAGDVLGAGENTSLKDSVEQQKQREQLEKQIATLEAKIRKEKQPKKKFEMVQQAKVLQKTIQSIG